MNIKGLYNYRRGNVLIWIDVFKSGGILRLMNFYWQIVTDATFIIERMLKFAP